MIKRILLFALTFVFLALGLVGLLIPILPGVLFLVAAAVCISAASPRVRRQLDANPQVRRWRRHWEAGEGLSLLKRSQLAFWLSADTAVKTVRRR